MSLPALMESSLHKLAERKGKERKGKKLCTISWLGYEPLL